MTYQEKAFDFLGSLHMLSELKILQLVYIMFAKIREKGTNYNKPIPVKIVI